MKPRLILVALGLAFIALVSLGLQAQEQSTPAQDKDKQLLTEQQLKVQFQAFTDALLRLQQNLARGTPKERERAEQLAKILKECNDLAIDQEFTKLLELMRNGNMRSLRDLQNTKAASDTLAGKLRIILDLMQEASVIDRSRQDDIKAVLKALNEAIKTQQVAEAVNQSKAKDKEKLANQKAATDAADKVKKKIDNILNKGKDPKDGKGGEAAPPKQGENKGEGKNEGKGGEAKNDGKPSPAEAKGSPKAGGDDPKAAKGETKPGSDKAGQPSKSGDEPKSGAKAGDKGKEGAPPAGAKASQGKEGDKNQGAAKKSDGADKGDKKEGGAKDDGKKADSPPMKDAPPAGSAKGDDGKKGGDPKSGEGAPPSDSKAKGGGDPKGGGGAPPQTAENKNSKGTDKGGEGKAGGDAKGGDGKQGESKSGESKSGQSSAKAGGAAPMPGNPSPPPPGGSAKDGGPPPPPSSGKPKDKQSDDLAQVNKKVDEAGYDQKKAEDKIKDAQTKDALKNQADAIAKMEEAKKKLENLLRQLREEEIERVLAALEGRCRTMLRLQQEVLAGTVDTEASINKRDGKKPDRNDKIAAQALSDKEKEIVLEANKCIDILQGEGTAVAFPEAFQQLRSDMMHVQKRLDVADVYAVTQDIEADIIDSLKEMIKALEKARDDNKSDPGKGGAGKAGKPADPKLLELVQELKMIRSLQKRVNDRTDLYGKRYTGEQAADPQVVRELRSLADRQLRIQALVRQIANGDNK